jgi:hypothetical protein
MELRFIKNDGFGLSSCEWWWINFVDYHLSRADVWWGIDSINEILQEYNARINRANHSIIFENGEQVSFFLLRWS